jgi:hypothetical protein
VAAGDAELAAGTGGGELTTATGGEVLTAGTGGGELTTATGGDVLTAATGGEEIVSATTRPDDDSGRRSMVGRDRGVAGALPAAVPLRGDDAGGR